MILASIIVPCYNEEKTIRLLLEAICRQTYPLTAIEVIIADGMSTDNTRSVIELFRLENSHLNLRVVDNPQKNIPSGLNIAIKESAGDVIIRLDAHSVPATNYVELCVHELEEGKGDNVGGVWKILPGAETWIAHSIAAAAANPLGVGDALYRFTDRAGYVDTVPFGSFRRELFDKIGFFDESLLTNEDYEFNTRLRQKGGRIWLNPVIQSNYYARSTFNGLIKQYWRYGFWKSQMLRRYPETIRWRQALPPIFVAGIIFLFFGGFFFPFSWFLLILGLVIYFVLLCLSAFPAYNQKKIFGLLVGVPIAIACMHISWGTALIVGLLNKNPINGGIH